MNDSITEVEAIFKIREDNIRISTLDPRYIESLWVIEGSSESSVYIMVDISSIICEEPYNINSVDAFYKLMDNHFYWACRVRAKIVTLENNPKLKVAIDISVTGFVILDAVPKFKKESKILACIENSKNIIGYVADIRINYFKEYEYMILDSDSNIVSQRTKILGKVRRLPVWYAESSLKFVK